MKKFNINRFKPCKDGLEYYESQPDFETAWNNCERGDWMLWIAKRLDVDDRILTLAKAHCANTVRHLIKDKRSIKAIDAAIKYGNGEINREELNKFASDAYDAYAAFYAAASAAAYAAYAAYAAADANNASYAAFAASYASYAAAYAAARVENQKQTANICRKYLTDEVLNKIK